MVAPLQTGAPAAVWHSESRAPAMILFLKTTLLVLPIVNGWVPRYLPGNERLDCNMPALVTIYL